MKFGLAQKEKIASSTSTLSGVMSFLGGYQVCHSVCLAIVSLLSLIGITLVGMPLLFLTKVAVPFWIAAVILLAITTLMYLKMRCISRYLLLLNAGILIAGVPFAPFQRYSLALWGVGGSLAVVGLLLFIQEKRRKKQEKFLTTREQEKQKKTVKNLKKRREK